MNNKVEILSASLHVYVNGESVLVDQGGVHLLPATGKETHIEWPMAIYLLKMGVRTEIETKPIDWPGEQ